MTDAIRDRVAEPDWEPTMPPGRIGINFRLPLAVICHFLGERSWVGTHPIHPGQAFYCSRCGRMNRDWWEARRPIRRNLRSVGVTLAPGESATFTADIPSPHWTKR